MEKLCNALYDYMVSHSECIDNAINTINNRIWLLSTIPSQHRDNYTRSITTRLYCYKIVYGTHHCPHEIINMLNQLDAHFISDKQLEINIIEVMYLFNINKIVLQKNINELITDAYILCVAYKIISGKPILVGEKFANNVYEILRNHLRI